MQPDLDVDTLEGRIAHTLTNLLLYFSKNPELTCIGFYLSTEAAQIKGNLDFEVKEGYFRQDLDTEMVAECLVGIIERLTFTQLLTKQKEPEVIAHEIVHLLLYGMVNK